MFSDIYIRFLRVNIQFKQLYFKSSCGLQNLNSLISKCLMVGDGGVETQSHVLVSKQIRLFSNVWNDMVSHSVQLLFIKPLILPHTSHTKSFALSFQFFTGRAAVFAEEVIQPASPDSSSA